MKHLSLNGSWQLEVPGWDCGVVPATVPGSVYHDLLSAGKIPDPFYRDNETEALKLMEHEFHYSRSFQADGALLDSQSVLLRCEGLDTLATIYVNGTVAGLADNMHRTWEFDVKALLREGENTIAVHFASPTKFIRESYDVSPADGSSDAMVGFPNLRKCHCMFGWDWGPRLPDAGIWRDIELIGVDAARIRDVLVEQFHEDGKVSLKISTHVTKLAEIPYEVKVSVTAPDGSVLRGDGLRNRGPESAALVARRVRRAAPLHRGGRIVRGRCRPGFLEKAHRTADHDRQPRQERERRVLQPLRQRRRYLRHGHGLHP